MFKKINFKLVLVYVLLALIGSQNSFGWSPKRLFYNKYQKSILILSTIAAVVGKKALNAYSTNRKSVNPIDQSTKNHPKLTPNNTIIICDLHDVLFKFSPAKTLIAAVNTNFLRLTYGFAGYTYHKYIKKNQNLNVEQYMLKRNNSSKYQTQVIKMLNCFTPYIEIVNLLRQLKTNSFNLFICSNINRYAFDQLNHNYPEAFTSTKKTLLFNAYQINDTQAFPDHKLNKHNASAYKNLLNVIANNLGDSRFNQIKYFIFLDDKQCNLDLAKKVFAKHDKKLIDIKVTNHLDLKTHFNNLNLI